MELEDLIKLVVDKETFLKFVEALRKDRELSEKAEFEKPSSPYGPDAGGWQNTSIENFLESSIAWAEDTDFGILRLGDVSPWRVFAEFLHLGKLYE